MKTPFYTRLRRQIRGIAKLYHDVSGYYGGEYRVADYVMRKIEKEKKLAELVGARKIIAVLQNEADKLGADSISMELLENMSYEELLKKERNEKLCIKRD